MGGGSAGWVENQDFCFGKVHIQLGGEAKGVEGIELPL